VLPTTYPPSVTTARRIGSALLQAVVSGAKPVLNHSGFHRLAIVLFAVLAASLAGYRANHAPVAGPWLAGILTAIAMLFTLWHPLWAWRLLIVTVALQNEFYGIHARFGWPWTPTAALAMIVVFYAVGRHCRSGVLAWVWLVSVGVTALHANVRDELILIAVLLAVPLVLGRLVSLLRGTERDLGQELAQRAVLEERARIARELHDVVAHHMSMLALRADSARYRFPGVSEDLLTEFTAIQATARDGMTELRRLLGVLRAESGEPDTEPQPDAGRIEELVDRVRAAGTNVRLELRGDYRGLPAGVALSTYRIIQEALSNAVRHAPGATVDVRLHVEPGELRLNVDDTGGVAAKPEDGNGGVKHGLLGMRERAAVLGGSFTAGARAEGGFAVAVTLPLDNRGI
jgi:signal transduction histidine kinase